MVVSEIQLYELLKAKIGSAEAEAFVNILEKKVDKKFEDSKDTLATKKDMALLSLEMAQLKTEMAQLESKLTRSIYFVGILQYLAILASVITIMRLMM